MKEFLETEMGRLADAQVEALHEVANNAPNSAQGSVLVGQDIVKTIEVVVDEIAKDEAGQ
jgi:hypothetical protein